MFATTADELLRFFRADVSDAVEPHLWPEDEAYAFMTMGWDALMKGANIAPKVMRLPIQAGNPVVPLGRKVLDINIARVVDGAVLVERNTNSVDFGGGDDYGVPLNGRQTLFNPGTGAPTTYVRDYERSALRLVPTPDADGELEVQCQVSLAVPMQAGMPLPSIDPEDLTLVLDYMKFRAYAKHDAETEDLTRSRFHMQLFAAGVAEREVRLRRNRRTPGTVRMEYP